VSDSQTAKPNTNELLALLLEEFRGLRADLRRRTGLPDVKIGKATMREWTGQSYEGRAASECPADFLLEYAGFLEWKANKDREKGEDKYLAYAERSERDALVCRKWAAANRGVVVEPPKKSFARPAERSPDAAPPPAQGEAETPAPPAKTTWSGGGKSGWGKAPAA